MNSHITKEYESSRHLRGTNTGDDQRRALTKSCADIMKRCGRVAQLVEQCPFKCSFPLRTRLHLPKFSHLQRTSPALVGAECSHSAVIVRWIVRWTRNRLASPSLYLVCATTCIFIDWNATFYPLHIRFTRNARWYRQPTRSSRSTGWSFI